MFAGVGLKKYNKKFLEFQLESGLMRGEKITKKKFVKKRSKVKKKGGRALKINKYELLRREEADFN